MLKDIYGNVFAGTQIDQTGNPATSVTLAPIVSAEWNQNLFNHPFVTVAGTGVPENIGVPSVTVPSGTTPSVTDATGTANGYNNGFATSAIQVSVPSTSVSYTFNTTAPYSPAYKIITYVQTDSDLPIQLNAHADGTPSQFGSTTVDINAFGFVKVITYVGSSSPTDLINSLTYSLVFNTYNSASLSTPINIYYTAPQVYPITYSSYQSDSLWPTDSVFSYFRPGESYVPTGNVRAWHSSSAPFDSTYRQITTSVIDGQPTSYAPITSITQNHKFTLLTPPTPAYKNVLPSDMSPYKYFVSDSVGVTANPSISGIYHPNTNANKIVLKFNAIQSIPTISVLLDGSPIASSITVPSNGLLILYYNGSSWSTTPWSTMPIFNNDGSINIVKSFGKITVTQENPNITSEFADYSMRSADLAEDISRMHVVEISPRIEVDLTSYVMTLDISKELDSKNNYIPISSINPNSATLTLSAIPLTLNNAPISIFSSQNQSSILYNMMRKNIKFYFNWHLENYFQSGEHQVDDFIPAGVYYADAWDETDIQNVKVSCFDIVNYLQMLPVPDYVASNKSIFDILTNIMDMAGFTDYDYDSLYNVTHDTYAPLDMYYYFCNSQSSTLYDALSELFLAHQIGAYIDEFGIMKFLSLADIMRHQVPNVFFNDSSIIQGGYSITNKTKPGAITVSYQEPKVTQSLSLQNAADPSVKNSPSFIYTTSNEVVWTQKDADSVGSNYLSASMLKNDNYFQMNNNSLLDIFHTYLLNNDGYAVIENELVSFLYKEYKISQTSDPTKFVYVYPKTDLELSSSINEFIKQHQVGLTLNVDGTYKPNPLDVTITPTGKIANVQRGLFGTKSSDHILVQSNISEKGLVSQNATTSILHEHLQSADNPTIAKIAVAPSGDALVYGNNISNPGYKTYSTKFDLNGIQVASGGVFFSTSTDQYSVNLIQVQTYTQQYLGSTFSTIYSNPPQYKYFITVVKKNISSGSQSILAMSEATGIALQIQQNWEKVLTYVPPVSGSNGTYSYSYATDQEYHLKAALSTSDGSDGEIPGQIIDVYLNNILVTGWQIPDITANNAFVTDDGITSSRVWKSPQKNLNTGLMQRVNISSTELSFNGNFGFITSTQPIIPAGLYSYPGSVTSGQISALLREIYACGKPLLERSVNYYYQDPEFLNGLIQNQNLFSQYPSYMMQTNPEVTGVNYYDIQYQTPAATSVDVLPIEYLWFYFPGTQPTDQQYYQQQMVDEYSLSYSTPINTGFRARLAVVNNVGHMVYITHASDSINQFDVSLNLWTHEVIAPSDPQIIQRVLDYSNKSEVIQVDSPWIQSKSSANRLIDVIAIGNDGFSRDTSIQIWGNPLIQVGDIINLNYSLAGIVNGKYLVHGVDHTFNQGLKTTLVVNSINKAVNPANS